MVQSHNQSTVILQQFSMITQELKSFTNKVPVILQKSHRHYNRAQENTGNLMENAISQPLTKAQNTTTSPTSGNPGHFEVNYANSSCETNWASAWPTSNLAMSQQQEINDSQTL